MPRCPKDPEHDVRVEWPQVGPRQIFCHGCLSAYPLCNNNHHMQLCDLAPLHGLVHLSEKTGATWTDPWSRT
jgi:hypothetical protein